ncbi:uncharacterized protein LOC105251734 isoform X2 [Camponotus floridanus]|uniref:uncharacterized protein LOC105251734 isoform X2 n=1 Tax=Camponotus floridanus TaxID=104421 RepID=UPI000DC67E21|nr:uncharacterized protein LOC105251734 isoform X2 [Camponotus floridanus]
MFLFRCQSQYKSGCPFSLMTSRFQDGRGDYSGALTLTTQAHVNKNKYAEIKQLDTARLADVEEYVYQKFGRSADHTKLFRIAVRNKCNNAKKQTSVSSSR